MRLTTKGYCAGIVLNHKGVCMEAAPILRWMIGKGEAWIKQHCKKHHIILEDVEEHDGRGRVNT